MNRQHRLQQIAIEQRAAEVNRLATEYERELLREASRWARGAEEPAAPAPRPRGARAISSGG